MKGMKFISYIVVCLALANCKVKFEDQIITVEKENYYSGDVENVTYTYSRSLEVSHLPTFTRLSLDVDSSSKVIATYEDGECNVTKKLDVKKFVKLVDTIKDSVVIEKSRINEASIIDGLDNEIIRVTEDGQEEMAFLKFYYPMFASDDSKQIKELVEEIIDELKADCEDESTGNIIALKYIEKNVGYPIYSGGTTVTTASSPPACMYPNGCGRENVTTREFKITVDNGVVRVSGSQTRTINNGFCFKNINNKVLDAGFIAAINKIDVRSVLNVCMAAPWGGASLQMDLHYAQGYSKSGFAGCWNEKQLINYTEFQDKFLAWLAKQPEDCAVGVY